MPIRRIDNQRRASLAVHAFQVIAAIEKQRVVGVIAILFGIAAALVGVGVVDR